MCYQSCAVVFRFFTFYCFGPCPPRATEAVEGQAMLPALDDSDNKNNHCKRTKKNNCIIKTFFVKKSAFNMWLPEIQQIVNHAHSNCSTAKLHNFPHVVQILFLIPASLQNMHFWLRHQIQRSSHGSFFTMWEQNGWASHSSPVVPTPFFASTRSSLSHPSKK